MSQAHSPEIFLIFLRSYAKRYRRLRCLEGLGVTALLIFCPLPFVCLFDRFFIFSDTARIAAWVIYVLLIGGALVWRVARSFCQKHSDLEVAFAVGDQSPELHQILAAAVEFPADQPLKDRGVSSDLAAFVRHEADLKIAELRLEQLLPHRRAIKVSAWAFSAFIIQIALLFMPNLEYPSLLRRFFWPLGNFDRVSGVQVVISPGSTDVGDGETVILKADVSDLELTRLGLYRSSEGGTPQRFEMNRVESGCFKFTLPNLRRDMTYYFAEGLIQTKRYAIQVMRRPLLESFSFDYVFPEYTKLSAQSEKKSQGDFQAPMGTRVTITTDWDMELDRAILRRVENDGATRDLLMTTTGSVASITIDLTESFNYQAVAFGKKLSLENQNRLTFRAEGTLALSELRARPGETISVFAEARDNHGQWGQSAPCLLQIPIASGDRDAWRQAETLKPTRAAVEMLRAQYEKTRDDWKTIEEKLSRHPPKWTDDLDRALTVLRPTTETLRHCASKALGAATQLKETLLDALTRDEFGMFASFFADFDAALERLELEPTLVAISQDFKNTGPQKAKEVSMALNEWSALLKSAASFFSMRERALRLCDLRARGRQLICLILASKLMAEETSLPIEASSSDFMDKLIYEMLDPESLAKISKQTVYGIASSANPKGTGSNFDNYISKDAQDIAVLADLKGPGCARRLFFSGAVKIPAGVDKDRRQIFNDLLKKPRELCFYFDGENTPRLKTTIQNLMNDIVKGQAARIAQTGWKDQTQIGNYLLRPLVGVAGGGYFCYLPLPYKKSLKITLDVSDLRGFSYQICYHTYLETPKNMKSYDRESLTKALENSELLARVNDVEVSPVTGFKLRRALIQECELKPGESVSKEIPVPGIIREMEIAWTRKDTARVRGLILRCYWDDEINPSIEVPVDDLFGFDHGNRAHVRLYPLYREDGNAGERVGKLWLPMPFAKNAKIVVTNENEKEDGSIPFGMKLQYKPLGSSRWGNFDHEFGQLRAKWVLTSKREGWKEPHTILAAKGAGRLLGCMLTVNKARSGRDYLEAPETLIIDGKNWGGTTMENFFNGFNGYTQRFDAAFHGVPIQRKGNVTQFRFFIPDSIPFEKDFRLASTT